MADLFWLSEEQLSWTEPHFSLSHGAPRVDNRRVLSGIIFVIHHGLRWRDASKEYGPHKVLYNRFVRWSRLGVFGRIFASLSAKANILETLMIDTTHLKAHRTASSHLKSDVPRHIGCTKGGLNSKLHAFVDDKGLTES